MLRRWPGRMFRGTCCRHAASVQHVSIDVADSTKVGKFYQTTLRHIQNNSQLNGNSCMNEDIRVYLIQQTLSLSIKQL